MADKEIMIVHAEAELGSSLIDLSIANADAVQLLALAELIHANGMAALASQMAQANAESKPSPLVAIHRSLDS